MIGSENNKKSRYVENVVSLIKNRLELILKVIMFLIILISQIFQ